MREPLEADRHLGELPVQALHDTVDQAAADQRLADLRVRGPVGPVSQQVTDRDGQVMVGVHEPHGLGDDPVAIGVGVVAERDVKAVLELDQARHRIRARAVHADLAVVVERHEPECRVDRRVGDGDVQAVGIGDRLPVMHGRAAQRVDAELEPAARIASMSMTLARSST